jgi:sn-glycerol 3-phosphate transport system ATP-binding protein
VRIVEHGGIEAVVQSAEYLGADTVVTCSTSAGGILADTIAARLPGRQDLAAGTLVRLAWPAEASHLFDHATGLRRDDTVPVPV